MSTRRWIYRKRSSWRALASQTIRWSKFNNSTSGRHVTSGKIWRQWWPFAYMEHLMLSILMRWSSSSKWKMIHHATNWKANKRTASAARICLRRRTCASSARWSTAVPAACALATFRTLSRWRTGRRSMARSAKYVIANSWCSINISGGSCLCRIEMKT